MERTPNNGGKNRKNRILLTFEQFHTHTQITNKETLMKEKKKTKGNAADQIKKQKIN